MPIKSSSSSDSEVEGQYPAKITGIESAERSLSPTLGEESQHTRGSSKGKKQSEDTLEKCNDFEEGIRKLKERRAAGLKGNFCTEGEWAPAFYPESLEQRNRSLEANWARIDQRKIEEERRGPPFGKAIQKYLTFPFKKNE